MAGPTVVVSVLADSKKFKAAMDDIGGSTSKMGGLVRGAGLAVVGALAGAAVALGGFAIASVGHASSLEQSIGGVQSVFKEMAEDVKGFSKAAAGDLGLSANSYNELATIIGTTLKNSGTPLDQLAGKTNDLVGRAADLAATFGGPVTEASNAMASALRGEFEPLRRYGVSLSVADINARALADSNKASVDELTKVEKAAAAQALIFEQSADAAGAFGRESDTLAGQQERLKANLENISATVGAALLPAMTAGAKVVNNFLGTISESEGFQTFVTGLGELVTNLLSGGAATGVFGDALSVVMAFLNPFGLVLQALAPLLPTLGASVMALGESLGGALSSILPTVVGLIDTLVSALSGVLAAVLPVIIGLVIQLADIFAQLAPVLMPVVTLLADVLAEALAQLVPVIAVVAETLGVVLGAVLTALAPVISTVAEFVLILLTALMPIIDVVLTLVEAFAPLLVVLGSLIAAILPPVVQLLMALLTPILALVGPIIGALVPAIQFLAAVLGAIIGVVVAVVSAFVGLVTGSQDATSKVRSVWDGILGFFRGIPGAIGGFFAGAGSWLVDAGRNIIQGLLNGIRGLAGTIGSFFLNMLPGWIVGPFKIALGIRSPSKLFEQFGRFIPEGLVKGVRSGFGMVTGVMGSLSGAVAGGFNPSFSLAGSYSEGRGSARSIQVNVNGGLSTSAEIGRAVVDAISEFERLNGKR